MTKKQPRAPLLLIDPVTGRIGRWEHRGPGLWGARETHAATVPVESGYHVGQVPVPWYNNFLKHGEINEART